MLKKIKQFNNSINKYIIMNRRITHENGKSSNSWILTDDNKNVLLSAKNITDLLLQKQQIELR